MATGSCSGAAACGGGGDALASTARGGGGDGGGGCDNAALGDGIRGRPGGGAGGLGGGGRGVAGAGGGGEGGVGEGGGWGDGGGGEQQSSGTRVPEPMMLPLHEYCTDPASLERVTAPPQPTAPATVNAATLSCRASKVEALSVSEKNVATSA